MSFHEFESYQDLNFFTWPYWTNHHMSLTLNAKCNRVSRCNFHAHTRIHAMGERGHNEGMCESSERGEQQQITSTSFVNHIWNMQNLQHDERFGNEEQHTLRWFISIQNRQSKLCTWDLQKKKTQAQLGSWRIYETMSSQRDVEQRKIWDDYCNWLTLCDKNNWDRCTLAQHVQHVLSVMSCYYSRISLFLHWNVWTVCAFIPFETSDHWGKRNCVNCTKNGSSTLVHQKRFHVLKVIINRGYYAVCVCVCLCLTMTKKSCKVHSSHTINFYNHVLL